MPFLGSVLKNKTFVSNGVIVGHFIIRQFHSALMWANTTWFNVIKHMEHIKTFAVFLTQQDLTKSSS